MKIELRNVKIARSLSEETTAYTATIYVDGKPAFHASNHGHGGADMYHAVAGYAGPSEAEIGAWLADHEPPMGPYDPNPATRALYDNGTSCDLELFVGRLLGAHEATAERKRIEKKLDRLLATVVVGIRDGALVTWKAAPTADILARLEANPKNADVRFMPTGAEGITARALFRDAALRAFCPDLFVADDERDTHEAVIARLQENRLTAADARYLLAQDKRAAKPDPDLHVMLAGVIAEGERREAEHRASRQAT